MEYRRGMIGSIYLAETDHRVCWPALNTSQMFTQGNFLRIPKYFLGYLVLTQVHFLPSLLDQELLESREFILFIFVPNRTWQADFHTYLKTFHTYFLMNEC